MVKKCSFLILVFIIFGLSNNCLLQERLSQEEVNKMISEINKKIKEKGYNWIAGITSKSALSPEEKRKLCGILSDEFKNPDAMQAVGDSLYFEYKKNEVNNILKKNYEHKLGNMDE